MCCLFFSNYRKALEEKNRSNAESIFYKIYVIVIAIYAGGQIFVSILMRIPACHRLGNQCDNWPLVRFIKWMHQVGELHYCYFTNLSLDGLKVIFYLNTWWLVLFKGTLLRWPGHVWEDFRLSQVSISFHAYRVSFMMLVMF